ncbi:heme-degrading monooxygenase HmoA [Chitinophaga dinghuensis]|uniref:Heme-degrading monooxygenase HmoA n=1 Tax=Chitinophaga dinghuensis TaxID=1539050 RepID=A0A327VRW4_9BACT|nr:alpha/beta fold hydrolase [Chitinophaga dinghuensis]RAJ77276.1 heme-degrading monooxygenase HmoA [Chitinophaga dinghuensis]
MKILKTASRLSGLQIAITHQSPAVLSNDYPILFLHGNSFPSQLAFGFKMNGHSWMDHLSENGYNTYALDFLGYGNADRYPEMEEENAHGKVVGSAKEVYLDVDKAVNYILQKTGKDKIYLIAHSWGGSVGALYASRFPEKIARLVLFAAITERHDNTVAEHIPEAYREMTPQQRIADMAALTPAGNDCVLEKEIIETWGCQWLQSDPLANKYQSDSVRFPAGSFQDVADLMHGKSYYNPAEIKAPTLIIRGEWDAYPNHTDAEKLFTSLEHTSEKRYVVIGKGTHVMHLENNRFQLYQEVLTFLQNGHNRHSANSHPIAVIFEVIPSNSDTKAEYLNIAASLKPELEKMPGFISIERFQSIYHPEKILSLSFWSDEKAIQQWRNLELHRAAQAKGRNSVFKDYHLRIAQVVRDYGMFDRKEAPSDSIVYHTEKTH